MENFVLPERVALDTVGGTDISTVKLNSAGPGYETCLFYANGDNDVVARYSTLAEALENHARIVSHEQAHLLAEEK
jgi:hypothetical protein